MNKLERAIFEWIKRHYNDPTLSKQINNLTITHREYTGHGFFLSLKVSENVPKLHSSFLGNRTINGPIIQSIGIQHGGGSILFHEDGFLVTLELYSRGGDFEKNIEQFELSEY